MLADALVVELKQRFVVDKNVRGGATYAPASVVAQLQVCVTAEGVAGLPVASASTLADKPVVRGTAPGQSGCSC